MYTYATCSFHWCLYWLILNVQSQTIQESHLCHFHHHAAALIGRQQAFLAVCWAHLPLVFIKSQQINLNSLYNHNKRICYLNQFDMKLICITILKSIKIQAKESLFWRNPADNQLDQSMEIPFFPLVEPTIETAQKLYLLHCYFSIVAKSPHMLVIFPYNIFVHIYIIHIYTLIIYIYVYIYMHIISWFCTIFIWSNHPICCLHPAPS